MRIVAKPHMIAIQIPDSKEGTTFLNARKRRPVKKMKEPRLATSTFIRIPRQETVCRLRLMIYNPTISISAVTCHAPQLLVRKYSECELHIILN